MFILAEYPNFSTFYFSRSLHLPLPRITISRESPTTLKLLDESQVSVNQGASWHIDHQLSGVRLGK
jgi:hypothetical protein